MHVEEEIAEYMRKELNNDLIGVDILRERRVLLIIKPEALRRAVNALKSNYSDLRFITITVVDDGLDFEFLHHFNIGSVIVTLKSLRAKEENVLESIADLIPASTFIEREIADLFGIKILGHETRNLILTRDWPEDKRPMRKPLMGPLPKQARPVAEALISTGCVAPISRMMERKRESAGLSKTPAFTFTEDEDLREYHGIMRDTSLSESVGFDWKRKKLRYR